MEVATLALLYGVYEVIRGQGQANPAVARDHTDGIVALERQLHLYGERAIQEAAHWLPGVPTLLGIAYHFFVDAVGGALAIAAGYAAASWVDSPATRVRHWQPARESVAALS